MKTKTTNSNRKINEVHNLIILDRSGSMSSIRQEAIAGVNETLGTIRAARRAHPEMQQFITIVAFCGCTTNCILFNSPIEDARNITAADYRPCCSTPLYDTMGLSLTRMRQHVKNNPHAAVSVTIITDGYENASTKWNSAQIKALVELLTADGWLFAYIGANQDLKEVSFNLSISNTMSFNCDKESTQEMFEKERACRKSWYGKVAKLDADDSIESCNDQYFDM